MGLPGPYWEVTPGQNLSSGASRHLPWYERHVDNNVIGILDVVHQSHASENATFTSKFVYDKSFSEYYSDDSFARPVFLIFHDRDGVSEYEMWRSKQLAHWGSAVLVVDRSASSPMPAFATAE